MSSRTYERISSTERYTTLHYTTLHYTTLHYTTLHYTTLRTAAGSVSLRGFDSYLFALI
jgi:hypothetical protein